MYGRPVQRLTVLVRCLRTTAASAAEKPPLNLRSRTITQPKHQGASQAMLYATPEINTKEDLNKPQVGIASVWWEGNPCNMHLLDLSEEIKGKLPEEVIGYRFNTIGVSDGISMGTSGMSYSLQSRDLIADSIETVMGGQWYDGLITIPGCDKNMPGCLIAMARVNAPSIMLYGGTIRAGCSAAGAPLDIVSAFQAYGEAVNGTIEEHERSDIIRNACPGAGACGGMYTANTMASAIEAMGMSLPGSSSAPADSQEKRDECTNIGPALLNLLEKNIRPSDIMTKHAFENAITIVMATGGSTNAVLHLIAMSRAVGVDLTLDDFQRISNQVPFIADLKPSGQYVMADLGAVGGIAGIMKMLLAEGMIHGDCMTVTGKTIAENLAETPGLTPGQKVIMPISEPIKETGHLQCLYGNLAPEGSVAKITGKEGLSFKGVAIVYDCEEDMLAGLEAGEIKHGVKQVVIIRFEGPKGGPGMPEMLTPTSAIMGAGLGDDCAMLTDGRFSGGSHGFIIGHITPEAQVGGPLAVVQNGDMIEIDAEDRYINLMISDDEMQARLDAFIPPPPPASKGTLAKYVRLVNSASHGCVTDEEQLPGFETKM